MIAIYCLSCAQNFVRFFIYISLRFFLANRLIYYLQVRLFSFASEETEAEAQK